MCTPKYDLLQKCNALEVIQDKLWSMPSSITGLTIDLDLPLSLPQGLLLPPFVATQQQQEVILGGSMGSNIPAVLSIATIMAWTECQVWVACQCLDICLGIVYAVLILP